MNTTLLYLEIFGMIVLAVLLYGTLFETKQDTEKNQAFILLICCVILTLLVDMITYLQIDWSGYRIENWVVTLLTYITPIVDCAVFLRYMYYHIRTKAEISNHWLRIGAGYCGLMLAVTIFWGFTDRLFTLRDGVYRLESCYTAYLSGYIIILLYLTVAVLINVKQMGWHDGIAALMFVVVPVLFIVINLIDSATNFSIASLTISIVIIYVTLQGEHVSRLIAEGKQSSSLAHHDELTGLLNRLAYSRDLEMLPKDSNIGVIFTDVNGLKYTNDHYGHKAGDELLKEFASILLSCYRKSDVYRISGDEFIVLLPGMPKETFERKREEFLNKVKAHEFELASAGFTYGSTSEVRKLIDMAEEQMYHVKHEFHIAFPEYSRK